MIDWLNDYWLIDDQMITFPSKENKESPFYIPRWTCVVSLFIKGSDDIGYSQSALIDHNGYGYGWTMHLHQQDMSLGSLVMPSEWLYPNTVKSMKCYHWAQGEGPEKFNRELGEASKARRFILHWKVDLGRETGDSFKLHLFINGGSELWFPPPKGMWERQERRQELSDIKATMQEKEVGETSVYRNSVSLLSST